MGVPDVWKPGKTLIKNANITKFMERHEIQSFEELVQRATTGIEWFWDSCVHETDISWFEPYTQIVDASEGFAKTRWFVGGRLNICDNCVDRHAADSKQALKDAVVWVGEHGEVKKLSYAELFAKTNQVANYLKEELGVVKNDRVALLFPMLPELLPVFFAVVKLGAIAVPLFLSYSEENMHSICKTLGVTVLFTADGYHERGQKLFLKDRADKIVDACEQMKQCVVIENIGDRTQAMRPDRDVYFADVVGALSAEASTEELSSDHIAAILHSVGPDHQLIPLVHTHGGLLAQVTKEFFLNFDIDSKDVFCWNTNFVDMIALWEIIGTTHFAATVLLAEGAPHPHRPEQIFELCEDHGVTHLGVATGLMRRLQHAGFKIPPQCTLASLRVIGAAGEPWTREAWQWCYENIGRSKLPILTMLCHPSILGSYLLPLVVSDIKNSSLQSPGLGMCVDAYAEAGYALGRGQSGYLVCKKPTPSMSKGFVIDKDLHQLTFFSQFKNVWTQGDWVKCDSDGHWFHQGSAGQTVKEGPDRIGLKDIEEKICRHVFVDKVYVSLGVAVERASGVDCFICLKKGIGLTRFLTENILKLLATRTGELARNSQLHFVPALPYTDEGIVDEEALHVVVGHDRP